MLKAALLAFFSLFFLFSCAPDEDGGKESSANVPARKEDAVKVAQPEILPELAKEAEKGPVISKNGQSIPQDDQSLNEPAPTGHEDGLAPTPEEYEWADRMLLFANQAADRLERTLVAGARKINDNTAAYLDTWHLAKAPVIQMNRNDKAALTPPETLLDQENAKRLAEALEVMEKSLSEMNRAYSDLRKYVADASIRDDGKRGRELGKVVEDNFKKFMAASRSWQEIVEARAEDAEQKFLHGHPLKRQIDGARAIFANFRKIAAQINSGNPDNQTLAGIGHELEKQIEISGRPPFNSTPGLERLYRSFLAKVTDYCKTLNRAIAEGMHGAQQRELNEAMRVCRQSYNEFVRKANFLTSQGAAASRAPLSAVKNKGKVSE